MKRFLIVCAAIVAGVGTIAQAQLTSNPFIVNTTNTTALVPLVSVSGSPTYGFGVALLGYPMKQTNSSFFAQQLDGIALSDGSTAPEPDSLQFYAASSDGVKAAGTNNAHIVGFRVLQSASNPNDMTVYKSWVATVQPDDGSAFDAGLGVGSGCAGSFGVGGVSKDGTIVVRMDGASPPTGASVTMLGEAVVVIPAQVSSTIVFTNALSNIVNNVNGSLGTNIVAIDSTSGNVPQIGQNDKLAVKNSFNGYSLVARTNINAGTLTLVTPVGAVVSSNAEVVVGSTSGGVSGFYTFANWNTRGAMGMNDTAKMLATYVKRAADLTTGGDSETGVAVIRYTDAGGTSITPTSIETNTFGSTVAGNFPVGGISTNAQYFFVRNPFAGPSQISINDSGAVAFAVSINIDAANDATNGTRAAQVTGIIYRPAGTTDFLKVCDNTDSSLFAQVPVACTNKNLISAPALDNYGNVYFEAAYSNNTAFSCDLFPSNAVYEAVANNPTNPTSWSVRILLRQGDEFTNSVSGDVFRVIDLPYELGPASRTTASRSLGANAVNRTQLPGHTLANTVPSDPFAVGGILVQASLSNLTAGVRSDGLLYVAPFSSCPTLAFVITSVSRSGANITINYNAQTGTNIIQVAAGGNYTGSGFLNLSTNVVAGCAAPATFTHVGGVTITNGYYRILHP